MGAAMEAVDSMSVVAGEGIVGNADRGGDRQVTILATERWADVEADLGRSVEPSTRRANLFVEGVEPQAFVWPGRYELAPRLANR